MPLVSNFIFASHLSPSSWINPTPALVLQLPLYLKCHNSHFLLLAPSISGSDNNVNWDCLHVRSRLGSVHCGRATKQPNGPIKKRSVATKKKKSKSGEDVLSQSLLPKDVDSEDGGDSSLDSSVLMPKPPAGFVVDRLGRVLMASSKRTITIVDPMNSIPLECVVRRVFRSSQDDECMLLYPIDISVQILKSTNVGWSAISDEEVQSILPTAAFALAKLHLHLVVSGFCLTVRGGFCYSEADIIEFHTDDGEDLDGLPTEGIEITSFNLDGTHYMIYTSCEPLLFVAVKDRSGQLQIADDELLEDPGVTGAIDEETEFNALVEEEAALMDSTLGKT